MSTIHDEDVARLRTLSDEDLADETDLRWEAFISAGALQLRLARAAVDRAEAETRRRQTTNNPETP